MVVIDEVMEIGAMAADNPTPNPKPSLVPALEHKQDWIVTIKLTESALSESWRQGWSRADLEYAIQSKLQQIDGIKVRQVMLGADGPGYY